MTALLFQQVMTSAEASPRFVTSLASWAWWLSAPPPTNAPSPCRKSTPPIVPACPIFVLSSNSFSAMLPLAVPRFLISSPGSIKPASESSRTSPQPGVSGASPSPTKAIRSKAAISVALTPGVASKRATASRTIRNATCRGSSLSPSSLKTCLVLFPPGTLKVFVSYQKAWLPSGHGVTPRPIFSASELLLYGQRLALARLFR
jgi:hypothetical protein